MTPQPTQQEMDALVSLFQQGHYVQLQAAAAQLTTRFPQFAWGWLVLGMALKQLGRLQEAVASYGRALQINPALTDAYLNQGVALRALGRYGEAEASYRQLLGIHADHADAHNNLGNVLQDQGRWVEALDSYRRAIQLKPAFAVAHNSLGTALGKMGRGDEAVASFRQAIHIKPDYAEAHGNLAAALQDLGQLEEALASGRLALQLNPNFAAGHNSLGITLSKLGRFDEAQASYKAALALDPRMSDAHSNLLFTLNYDPVKSPQEVFAAYQGYDEQFGRPQRAAWQPHANSRDVNRRLKVGYVSSDFLLHSSRHFLEPLLAHHRHDVVEVYAYSGAAREDAVTERYKTYADHWVRSRGLSNQELAARIRADGIDILVDVSGHTSGNRLEVFARKPAPVSISWLGFGYTTGLSAVDYFLCDEPTVPQGHGSFFSETPWRLRRPALAYRPAEGMGDVNALPAIAQGHVTFGTLTRSVRVNHRTVRRWAQVLNRVENSRLVIDSRDYLDARMRADLAAQFEQQGVARERVRIGFHTPPWDLMRTMDITLDCFPHNSGTTLFESLYMGIPFVTLADRPGVGRLGSAILTGVGHTEWMAQTEEDYVEVAVSLARDLPRLASIRAGLRADMQRSPLMDEAGFAAEVEAAYRQMWRRWLEATGAGAPAIPISPGP